MLTNTKELETINVDSSCANLLSLFDRPIECLDTLQSLNQLHYLPLRAESLGDDDKRALDVLVLISEYGFSIMRRHLERALASGSDAAQPSTN